MEVKEIEKKLSYAFEQKEMFLKFTKTLLSLTTERETSLKRKDYELLLKTVVENLTFANSGSVLFANKDGLFSYVAAYNHDFNLLKNVRFDRKEMDPKRFKKVCVVKSRGPDLIKELSSKIEGVNYYSKETKSIEYVTAFISIPIKVHRKIVGFFNIDTWESENVFEESGFLPVASMMGDILSMAVERFYLIQNIKELNSELSKNALIDTTTFLPNIKFLGSYFDKYIAMAKRSSSNLYLIRLKLNDYDKMSQTFDKDCANTFVRKVSKILTKIIRKSDLLTYLGDGNFVILSVALTSPFPILERVKENLINISKDISKDLGVFRSVSFTLAEYGKDGKNLDSLLAYSEKNMETIEFCEKK